MNIIEDITEADYVHAKRISKDFEIKNWLEYWASSERLMYVQYIIALLLAGVFENFRIMRIKIYEIDPARFFTTPRLAWQEALKKGQSKSRFFNWYQYVANGRKRY